MNRMLAITRGRLRPLFVVGAIALVLALAFSGLSALDLNTGGGDDDDDAYVSETSGSNAPVQPGSIVSSGGAGVDQSAQPPSGGVTAESGEAGDLDAQRNAVGGSPAEQRIIRTANVEVTVRDGVAIGDALNQVRSISGAHGGYILASNSYTDDQYEYGSITLRVPADQFDQALAELRSSDVVGKVEHEETSTQDVTGEFIDNASRLRALHATEARFLELLSEASNLDNVLRIEYELQTVRSEIETIEGRQQYLDTMTTYSTITVALSQSGIPQIADVEKDDPFLLRVLSDSWDNASGAMESLLRGTLTLTLVAIAMIPAAIVLLLLFRGFRAWQRRSERRQMAAATVIPGSGD